MGVRRIKINDVATDDLSTSLTTPDLKSSQIGIFEIF